MLDIIKSIFADIPFPCIVLKENKIIFKNQLADHLSSNFEKYLNNANLNNRSVSIQIQKTNYTFKIVKYQTYRILICYNFDEKALYLKQIYLFSEIFNHILDGIAVLDENERNLFVNLTYLYITKYSYTDIIGEKINVLSFYRNNYPEKYKEIRKALDINNFWEGELWYESPKRKLFPINCKFLLIENDKNYIVEIFNDLTEIKKQKDYQQYLKYYNEFLDIPNEYYLKERVKDLISKSKKFYLVFLSLVNLKQVNDVYGRKEGDIFLKNFVDLLKNYLDINQIILFYLGANNFAIILKDYNNDKVEEFMKKLIKYLNNNPIKLGKYEIDIKIRSGIYLIDKKEDYEDIFNKLRVAEEYARRKNKIYTFFKNNMQDEILTEYKIESLIKSALKKDNFFLNYQPKIDLKNFKVNSAETLIRMKDDKGNIISPGKFIPIAEKTDLIHEIGKIVLDKIVKEAKIINSYIGKSLKYAINVSANQFIKPDFIEIFENLSKHHPELILNLEIEITEWALMKQQVEAIKKMKKLKNMGFTLVIDDFGTGYSSLAYIKDFPIDCIKIDKIFTYEIPYNEKTVNIVESIIYLAKKLNLKVTAEGVEFKKQLDWFIKNNIEEIQGFYFSKPLSLVEFVNFVKKFNKKAKNEFVQKF